MRTEPFDRLLRGASAPDPRTLVDVLRQVCETFPDAPALDNGAEVLTYRELEEAAEGVATSLDALGVGRGSRVGVRIPSGTTDLYVAILGTLLAGAAYVPVDADDPDQRARLIFDEATVSAVVGAGAQVVRRSVGAPRAAGEPGPGDDAWVIFTSGSTGVPKGVAVTHRSAAAFVDAETRLFVQGDPLGPGDRVMSGLSVGFDASCEEMWLAWRSGACLVPAPRSLVRSGIDLGPWLVANRVTVVSTVPTLAGLWPLEALDAVRLLVLGGEACPPELGQRLARAGREVWNTYGPTEATVVSCAAPIRAGEPIRIGLPLDGWDLAVVDEGGARVPAGQTGELVIRGVGLGRYLDAARDEVAYAPMTTLGWARAYRSGDLVREEPEGLVFVGRADDQVKLGGRRIELGEVDGALSAIPGVTAAAAAVRRTTSGNSVLVGYLAVDDTFDQRTAMELLRRALPAALVPRLAAVDGLPTKTSGKIDRDALPWPLPPQGNTPEDDGGPVASRLPGTAGWLQELWGELLGVERPAPQDDFFDAGGGSLTAAQLVGRLRVRFPTVTIADVYASPTVAALAVTLDALAAPSAPGNRPVPPVPVTTQAAQLAATLPLRAVSGLRWLTWVATGGNGAALVGAAPWVPTVSWWWIAAGWLVLQTPPGRILLAAGAARALTRPLTPGTHPRGGRLHLRLWLAERLADEIGVTKLSSAAWMVLYARALGGRVGEHVDLHSVPPVTGWVDLGRACSIEPEVDLSGHWLDGDVLHVGPLRVGAWARIGPGAP